MRTNRSATSTIALPWPFIETAVGDAAWHNHDTEDTCIEDHPDHPLDHPCGFGEFEGDHESDDAYAQDWNWMFGSPAEEREKKVLSVMRGEVLFADQNRPCGYGQQVIILRADKRYALRYTHLSDIFVMKGHGIGIGNEIGRIGNSGSCRQSPFDPHLHVAVYAVDSSESVIRILRQGGLPCGPPPRIDREIIPATSCAQRFGFTR